MIRVLFICHGKRAVRLIREDYDKYDYIIGMDSMNMTWMRSIIGSYTEGKLHKLMDFTDKPRDVADPWYTGNFDVTYEDILKGCEALMEYLLKKQNGRRAWSLDGAARP